MSNTNNTYLAAVNSIRAHIDEQMRKLECAATAARLANIEYFRKAALEGITTDSPLYPLAETRDASISIGREDGCPEIKLTEEAKKALTVAFAVGLLNGSVVGAVAIYDIATNPNVAHKGKTHTADYDAWKELCNFRAAAKKAEAL